MSVLSSLVEALASGAVEVIDLTAPLHEETPILQLPEPFGQTARFAREEISRYDDRGPAWYWNNIRTGEHTGTHFDAPIHWVTGRDGDDVSPGPGPPAGRARPWCSTSRPGRAGPGLPARGRARPGVGGRARAAARGRLAALPHRLGRPLRRPGRDSSTPTRRGPHTPGHLSVECARWLAEESAPILGLGVETVGTDAGAAHSFDPPFPCHSLPARRGQVRPDPAAEPRPAAGDRRGRRRGAAADRRRVRQPGPGAGAGRALTAAAVTRRRGRRRRRSPGSASGTCSASSAAATSTSRTRCVAAGVPVRRGPPRGRRGDDGRRLRPDERAVAAVSPCTRAAA